MREKLVVLSLRKGLYAAELLGIDKAAAKHGGRCERGKGWCEERGHVSATA